MKKLKLVEILTAIVLIGGVISIPLINNHTAYKVETQEGQSIEVIDHETLQFSEEIKDSGYYIVYSWGSGNSLLEELDIRGH